MKRWTLLGFICVAVLIARNAAAAECTHDEAVESMTVLQSIVDAGDHFGFPFLPTDVADLGAEAGIPYIETLPADALALAEKNNVAALHQGVGVHYALEGRCGTPLTDDERRRGRSWP